VRVRPRASRDRIEGWVEGVLQVRLGAPPVEGAANQALVRLVADGLGVAKGRVKVSLGDRSRSKVLEVEGLTLEEVKKRLS
jgi:uncharacterized protein (TIGR00251 family)